VQQQQVLLVVLATQQQQQQLPAHGCWLQLLTLRSRWC
jgi:hypothetical protein